MESRGSVKAAATDAGAPASPPRGISPPPRLHANPGRRLPRALLQVPSRHIWQWVQDALDSIEFISGAPDSRCGALRAAMGHPQPWQLTYVAIGNEVGGQEGRGARPGLNARAGCPWMVDHKTRHSMTLDRRAAGCRGTHPTPTTSPTTCRCTGGAGAEGCRSHAAGSAWLASWVSVPPHFLHTSPHYGRSPPPAPHTSATPTTNPTLSQNYEVFYGALKAAHPHLHLIASCHLRDLAPTEIWEYHVYTNPQDMWGRRAAFDAMVPSADALVFASGTPWGASLAPLAAGR